jgi:probable F420-dependent oxidoreductase
MRIGVQPLTGGPAAAPGAIRAFAQLADELGYDSLQVPDHVVVPVGPTTPYPYHPSGKMGVEPDDDFYEPLSLIGYLLGLTRRLRIGTSVLVAPLRDPLATAKQLACLDVLSDGRVTVAVGVGWLEEEFAALRAPSFRRRGKATDEVIEIFRRAWREHPVEFHGEIYSFGPVGVSPKPAQPGGIPILVGGNSEAAIDRAVRLGDGWQPLKLSPAELEAGLAHVRAAAARHGRSLDGFSLSLRLGLRIAAEATERRPGEDEGKVLVGTVDEVAAQLRAYEALGVGEAVFDLRTCAPAEVERTLELGAAGLLPRFTA